MALRSADGTVLTRAGLDALLTPVVDPDPLVSLDANVYEDEGFENASARGLRLKWRAGAQVRTSEIDAAYAVPTVTAVAPNTGPAAGGTAVTVTGTGFQSGFGQDSSQGPLVGGGTTGVTFDGAAASNVKVVSDTQITCTAPAGAVGPADVVVTTDAGASAPRVGGYTYT
jgi:hypothetical protein